MRKSREAQYSIVFNQLFPGREPDSYGQLEGMGREMMETIRHWLPLRQLGLGSVEPIG